MDSTEILLSIKDFEQRYSLTRSNIYNRINGLKEKGYPMEPSKAGNRSIYNADQGAIMDRLHEHLSNGNDIGSFPTMDGRVQLSQPADSPTRHPIERLTAQQDNAIDRSPATLGVAALVDAIALVTIIKPTRTAVGAEIALRGRISALRLHVHPLRSQRC